MLLNKRLYDKYFSDYWIDSIGQQKISFSNLSSVDSYIYISNYLMRTIYLGDLINENVGKGYSRYLSRILQSIDGSIYHIGFQSTFYIDNSDEDYESDFGLSGYNQTIILSKTIFQSLRKPHGNCSSYDGSRAGDRPFRAVCHRNCIRRCVRYYYCNIDETNSPGCQTLFIDNYLHGLDFYKNLSEKLCFYFYLAKSPYETNLTITAKCMKYCPKDCLRVEYKSRVVSSDSDIGNDFWHNLSVDHMFTEKSLVWDSTQPVFVYREEPLLSFTDYMSYTGGLFGLWFGTNGKDLIIWFAERMRLLWRWVSHKYQNFNNKVHVIQLRPGDNLL